MGRKIIINTIGFILIATLVPSFHVSGWVTALIASVVLAVLNLLVKPILLLLTLPINFLTFGLFSFIINAFMLSLTSFFMGNSFYITSFGMTIVVSILLTIFQQFVEQFTEPRGY